MGALHADLATEPLLLKIHSAADESDCTASENRCAASRSRCQLLGNIKLQSIEAENTALLYWTV